MEKFKNLGLSELSIQAIESKGFEEPTEIQEKVIPILLQKKINVIAQAQTGTGKTAAFGLAFIEQLTAKKSKVPQALVLVPTRELALQVAEEINSLKGEKDFSIVPVYGGQSINLQLRQFKRGVDIVIGTPGRIIDHLERGTLIIDKLDFFVLDEADEMLNMGFIDDIDKIFSKTNNDKRLLLFSATMPERIINLVKKYIPEYELLKTKEVNVQEELINQIYFEVYENDKFEALCRIIDSEKNFYGLVFCRTKVDVDKISSRLKHRGYNADSLHGDIQQNQREYILKNFKNKSTTILVATDVAARGIDILNLTHVINFALPYDPESYIHRIGRTGRAGNEGTAITFVTPEEYKRLYFIKRITKSDITKQNIPDVKDVISIKKENIKNEINEIIRNENIDYYKDFVDDIVGDTDKIDFIAALLKYSFSDALDISNYSKIKAILKDKRDYITSNNTRLFLTTGRKDNMTPIKLIRIIEKECDIPGKLIRNIDIFDSFSFITVPLQEAEVILKLFKRKTKKTNFIVKKALERKKVSNIPDNRKNFKSKKPGKFKERNIKKSFSDFNKSKIKSNNTVQTSKPKLPKKNNKNDDDDDSFTPTFL